MATMVLFPLLLMAACLPPVSTQSSGNPCDRCSDQQFCFKGTEGTTLERICIDCNVACDTCTGPGPDECVECKVGYWTSDGKCTKCDPGMFGPSCNSTCHCLDVEACDHVTGMCIGKCEKGYYKPPKCQEECPDMFYGMECLGECHCVNDSICDKVLGFCPGQLCHPDYVSHGCSKRLPKLAKPPDVIIATCEYVTVSWKAWEYESDFGDLPPAQYRLWKRRNDTEDWEMDVLLQNDPSASVYIHNVTSVQGDYYYVFRVNLHYSDDGKIVEQTSTGLVTEPVLVPCTTTTTPPPKTIPYIIGTEVFNTMSASNQPDGSFLVTWSIDPDLEHFLWSVDLSYQVIGIGDCAPLSGTNVTVVPVNQTDNSYRVVQPLTWTKYLVKLTAQGQDVISSYNGTEDITTITSEVVPSGNVTDLRASNIQANSVTLIWKALPCAERGGVLVFYNVTVRPVNITGAIEKVTSNVTSAVVEGLLPFTFYQATVQYVNSKGKGPLNDPVIFSTAQGAPGPVSITGLTTTMTSMVVSFLPPQPANGIVTEYYILFSDTPAFILPTSLIYNASFTAPPVIERLKSNTIYYVKVRAMTEAGYGPYGSVMSNRTLHAGPLPPSSLLLSDRNTTCVSLTWVPPDQSTIPVTGYLVSIIKVNSTQGVTQPVSASTTQYTHCGLDPGSAYDASVTSQSASGVGDLVTIRIITEQGQPLPPPSPVLIEVTNTTATITVEPSLFNQGPITAYQLQLEKKRQPAGRRKRLANLPGYVTAQLSPAHIKDNKVFVIGDGVQYGGYNNLPLDSGQTYQLYYIVISTLDGITKTAYTVMNGTITTVSPPATTTPTLPLPPSEDSNTGLLIGIILALIFLILVILAVIFIIVWWRRRQNALHTSQPYLELDKGQKKKAIPREPYDPEKYWNEITSLRESRYIVVGRECLPDDQLVPVSTQIAQPGATKVPFKKEFHSLPHKFEQATTLEAEKNPEKNRFPHILAYDHSRVELAPDASSRCRYINANYISGYKRPQCYVAAQSPYDDSTAVDFWRLIYQLNIKTVVMIVNIVEDNIVKCTQFWPEQGKVSIGQFYLELQEEAVYADFTMRDISVRESREPYGRTVRLFEYTSWPEHGVPDDPIPFLDMRYKVRQYHADEVGPILVHCGTGVARTGVFVAVDSLIDQYASEGRVSVFSFVRKMRKERPLMVRTFKQYVFIYECLLEEFHAGDTMTDTQSIKRKYHDWTSKNFKTGHTFLRDQFQLLQRLTRGPEPEQCAAAMLPDNLKRNRYPDVIPSDQHRPVLQTPASLSNTDYINAIYVNGYRKQNQFLLTQTPMHTTLIDFWRMVYDQRVATIVMMDNYKHEDDTCAEYWPTNVIMKQWEPFFVETTAAFQQENVTIRNLKIINTLRPRDPAHMVRQFQFNAWAESSFTPVSKTMALDLLDLVLDYQESSDHPDSPIVVHCEDGATHSGLFVSLALLCERMSEEQEVDVYHVIKHIKRRRTQIINDYDQFRFCYKTLWDYMNLRMPGGTFTDTLGQNKTDKLYGVASLSLTSYQDSLY